MEIYFDDMRAALGLKDGEDIISVETPEAADRAIGIIDEASAKSHPNGPISAPKRGA